MYVSNNTFSNEQYLHAPSRQIFVVDPADADSDLEDSREAAKCFR